MTQLIPFCLAFQNLKNEHSQVREISVLASNGFLKIYHTRYILYNYRSIINFI